MRANRAQRGAKRTRGSADDDPAARDFPRRAVLILRELIDARPDFLPRTWFDELPPLEAFGALMLHVVGQHLSVRATQTIVSRLPRPFDDRHGDAKGEDLAVAELRQDIAGPSPPRQEHSAARTSGDRRHREREIVHVLTRRGLHFLVGILSLEPHGGHDDLELDHFGPAAVPARELRLALEELGPTFIKLGQLLSMRALRPTRSGRPSRVSSRAASPRPSPSSTRGPWRPASLSC